jgi:putative membrane protein
MLKKLLLGVGIAVAVACSAASAPDTASMKFISEAIQGNLAEVQVGQLAQQKGTSEGVRTFGQHLEQDHGAAREKAVAVATELGATPPTEPNRKQKRVYERLSKLSGAAFDKAFAKAMVDDHKTDIKAYEKAAKKQDAAGRYANETLPKLREHLEMAQSLARGRSASR